MLTEKQIKHYKYKFNDLILYYKSNIPTLLEKQKFYDDMSNLMSSTKVLVLKDLINKNENLFIEFIDKYYTSKIRLVKLIDII